MMSSLRDKLLEATVRTFEGLAFMFVARPFEEDELPASFEAATKVSFHGVINGSLYLISRRGVLRPLTTNMLGEDMAAQPNVAADALGEAANVICGNFLSGIDGAGQCFHLDTPVPVAAHCIETVRSGAAASLVLGVDEGRAEVILLLDSVPAGLKEAIR